MTHHVLTGTSALIAVKDPALRGRLEADLHAAGVDTTLVEDEPSAHDRSPDNAFTARTPQLLVVGADRAGLELVRELRARPDLHDLPVLLVAASPAGDDLPSRTALLGLDAVELLGVNDGRVELITRARTLIELTRLRRLLAEGETGATSDKAPPAGAGPTPTADTPQAAWLTDAAGTLLAATPGFAALTDRPSDAVVGQQESEMLDATLAVTVEQLRQQMPPGRGSATTRVEVQRAGELRELEVVSHQLLDAGGTPNGALTIARDITRQSWERQRLLRAEADLREAQELARLGSWWMDLSTGALTWSPMMRELFGVAPDGEVSPEVFNERLHPEDRDLVVDTWRRSREQGTPYALDHRIVVNGEVRWVRAQGRFERDAQGRASGVGVAHDITERKHNEQLLATERARLQDAFEAAGASAWEWDLDTDQIHLDAQAQELAGKLSTDGSLSMPALIELIHPDDLDAARSAMRDLLAGQHERYDAEYRLRRPEDGWIWLRLRGRVVTRHLDGSPRLVRGLMLDVTWLHDQQEQVRFAQTHDGLTGLANRQRFTETLREILAADPEHPLAVLAVDLDDFEAVNHTHGRATGNLVLSELATRLLSMVEAREHLARTGGDEFSLLLGDPDSDLAERTDELHELIATPIPLRSGPITLTASIGLTTSPQRGSQPDADQLLRQADQAVYQAKLSGKNRTHRFDLAHHEHTRARYALIDELSRAMSDGQLIAYFQPQVDLRTGRLLGTEALVRWQHPSRGLLPPGVFIPATQGHPIAIELGTHILDVALTQLETWQAAGLHNLTVAVNTDTLQLEDPAFFERTMDQLHAHATLRPEQLTLEILETGAPEDLGQVATLIDRFQEAGITIALDDFGTGFASLTFLKRLAAQLIKIDRSFTQGLFDDPADALIVHAVTTLASNLGRTVFAEGIETVDQGRLLLQLGCSQGQGYYIARPMPGDELPGWAASWQHPALWASTEPLAAERVPALLAELRRVNGEAASDG